VAQDWMISLHFPMNADDFDKLPRHPAYRYRHHEGHAWLTPSPRYLPASLDLLELELEGTAKVPLRPLLDEDWPVLKDVFAESFANQPPFAGLPANPLKNAASICLERTRENRDGPIVSPACFVAQDTDGTILGAVIVTLVPLNDPREWGAYIWEEPPPADAIDQREGRPHLTWIFVRPNRVGHGIGAALLEAASTSLRKMGFDELHSTILLGNDLSLTWHWRMGFRLLTHPSSRRDELRKTF